PFALELAAARIRALTVDQIAALLHNELRFLTGGSRHAPPRQQTLRAMLDWSYALLQEPEQRLLQRLSVFVGGWRREAAEAVCAGEGIPSSQVLNLLQSLIDKSLVVFGKPKEAEEHYHLLEMVRQFAAEHLHASGEREERKFRHLEWCLTFAEQAESALSAGEQAVWLPRLEREHGNLRAALGWRLQTGKAGERKEQEARSYAPIPLRLCGALLRFWHTRGHLAEGRAWCESALQTDGAQERTAVRAKVLNGVGMLAHAQSDYVAAHAYFEESLAIRREIGDRSGIATSLNSLGNVAEIQGDYVVARAYFGESLTIRREIGDRQGIATALNNLGIVAFNQGDTVAARACFEESLKIQREIGNRPGMAGALGAFAMLIATETAAVLASAAMADASEKAAAGMRGAARLFGAAQALQTQIGTPLPPRAQEECDRYIAQARSVLGEDGFAAVWEEGRTMAWEQAVAYALKEMAD
ncbi:MAG TPA: tetratricopeptide repeat protein, partial [Chthonomonadaceae bacterium]|nr:tetratricopeptide repeat protein [Chthonomonadaceae bacterium]